MMEETLVEDVMAIAQGYREATELDTVELLNAQSRASGEGSVVLNPRTDTGTIENMQYYLVSSLWMKRAWNHVLKPPTRFPPNWQETVGPIDNAVLTEGGISEGDNSNNQSAGMPTGTVGNAKLRAGLQHEHDFYLVGSRAWLLLSQKFGVTHTFPGLVRVHTTVDSKMAIDPYSSSSRNGALSNQQKGWVPIPASGRFPYETSLAIYDPADSAQNPQDDRSGPLQNQPAGLGQSASAHSIEVRQQISDSDSDLNSNVAMKDSSSGGVPEDDEISGPDDNPSGRVLLLPASSSAIANGLFSPVKTEANSTASDDFGFGNNSNTEENNTSDDYWAMDSETVEPVPSTRNITTVQRFRYGSGLGNLGNTCFMNSTLQCLGHTHALQRYFISGEFNDDLNRDNPLGTGGELASEFAKLMNQMWSEEKTVSVPAESVQDQRAITFTNNTTHVVYPRDFKYTVGKHAEQFMGYDQHDSQEFATYLLDALHEDTNKVTKKPYIENPEQGEDETDEESAEKAWGLHLQRENSRVLENFMGQVKSRVQCSEPGCGRVSTTFEPFMYLSVPIPGSSERTISVVFVPLDPLKRAQQLSITLPKAALIKELIKRTRDELVKLALIESKDDIALEDMVPVDVWQKEVYTWYKDEDDVDKIRDQDETFIYQVRSAATLRAEAEKKVLDGGDEDSEMYNLSGKQQKHYKLDLPTMTRINGGDTWTTEFSRYLQNNLGFLNAFNLTKGTNEERVKLYRRTQTFLDACYNEVKDLDNFDDQQPNQQEIRGLQDRCDASPVFENVKSIHDLAILEFCTAKMRSEILRLIKLKKSESPGGVKIQVRIRSNTGGGMGARATAVCVPLILRLPTSMTAFELREELASRFSRAIRRPGDVTTHSTSNQMPASGQATSEEEASDSFGATPGHAVLEDSTFGKPEFVLMRQLPLTCDRKSPSYTTKQYDNSQQLGSIEKARSLRAAENGRPPAMASPKDSEEHQVVAHLVGENGIINVEWTPDMLEASFDAQEWEAIDDPKAVDNEGIATRSRKASSPTASVLDCIEKYCQMEQLEETEMWYCNKCKKHVRAWKQIHLYRTPAVLIVHLKRFQYSATTHRRDKISQFIDFPLKGLDLTEHVMHWEGDEKPIYDCYAVSNHYGGLGGGHYTAHAMNDDKVWCYYDDSRITPDVDPKDAVSDAAYVLYYRRRDLAVDDNFLLNIQTPDEVRIVRDAPAVISDIPNHKGPPSEISGSNAAIVDDDHMDVEDASHSTSVMGSMDGADDFEQHNYEGDDGDIVNTAHQTKGDDGLPRQ
eukprot:CAMPEP_0172454722 /NCGR_PEP_ID=MMETSP1065-20121228/11632_1 /TAXON_ID=265537 /ORGANISM="Amphiprora paludosa, Strain CCMP125" /LENGTH=1289 /DNA_ID=CAMNT_0013207101 /DNA_START=90 /DNA_END=3959 /DNA_ORIENTATION=+